MQITNLSISQVLPTNCCINSNDGLSQDKCVLASDRSHFCWEIGSSSLIFSDMEERAMKKLSVFLCAMVLVFGALETANASSSYTLTYVGATYAGFDPETGNTYNDTMSLTGEITLNNPLPLDRWVNLVFEPGFAFRYFDGVNTISSSSGGSVFANSFALTLEDGVITDWNFSLTEPSGEYVNTFNSLGSSVEGWPLDGVYLYPPDGEGSHDSAFTYTKGVWYPSDPNETVVPIPSAIWLSVSGLVGLVGLRKRFQNK